MANVTPQFPVDEGRFAKQLERRVGRIAIRTSEGWHYVGGAGEPAFLGTWANYDAGSTWQSARFRRHPSGLVEIQGLVALGALSTAIFTLPAGYRPAEGLIFSTHSNAGGADRLDIEPDGDVVSRHTATAYVSICVCFSAG